MALTTVVNGAFSDQLNVNQFINLFTGVMTDQPITFGNSLTVNASISTTNQGNMSSYSHIGNRSGGSFGFPDLYGGSGGLVVGDLVTPNAQTRWTSSLIESRVAGTTVTSISSTGLGVGTQPSTQLHVLANSPEVRIAGNAANQNLQTSFWDNNATSKGQLIYAGGNVGGSRYIGLTSNSADFVLIGSLNNVPIEFFVNNAERFRATATGIAGVGGAALIVDNGLTVSAGGAAITSATVPALFLATPSAVAWQIVMQRTDSGSTKDIQFFNNAGEFDIYYNASIGYRFPAAGTMQVLPGQGVDTASAGTLNLGTTNANALAIGRAGQLSTFGGPVTIASGNFAVTAGDEFLADGRKVFFGGANGSQSYSIGILAVEPTRTMTINARMAGADMRFVTYDGSFNFRGGVVETTFASLTSTGLNQFQIIAAEAHTGSSATEIALRGFPGGYGAGITFQSTETGTSTMLPQGSIEGEGETSWNAVATANSFMRFSTAVAGVMAEKMRITSSGNVQIQAGAQLDTTGAGTLGIGTTNATTVSIGKSSGNIIFNGSIAIPSGFSLDTTAVGQLNIGTINASPINIGRAGIAINSLGLLTVNAGGVYGAGSNAVATTNYVQARGQNLVSNGSGLQGNNYNFSSWTFDQVDTYSGAGSFYTAATQVTYFTDELIPVDPTQTYVASTWGKSGDIGGGNFYASNAQFWGVAPYDIDGNAIVPEQYSKVSGSTDTTLAVQLNVGATTMTLTNATGWSNVASPLYQNNFTWWPYTNAKGYSYPNYTYSRNISNSFSNNGNNGCWVGGGISGNVITLRVPWAGPQLAAGTPVRNHTSGGTYKYIILSNGTVPNAWTFYSGFIGGIDVNGTQAQNQFPYGTAYVKMEFVLNNQGAQANTVRINNIAFGLQPTFFGHAPVTTQPGVPVTLADVIAVIRGSGLSA